MFDVLKRVYKTGNSEHFPLKKYDDNRISGWRENFVYKLSDGEIVSIYNDITVQKKYEELLNEYKLAIESSEDSICCINKNYKIIFTNQAFINQFKIDKNKIEGMNIKEIFGNEYFIKYIQPHSNEALKGKAVNYEMETENQEINKQIIKVNYYPIKTK